MRNELEGRWEEQEKKREQRRRANGHRCGRLLKRRHENKLLREYAKRGE
jgi:hypothetical protein